MLYQKVYDVYTIVKYRNVVCYILIHFLVHFITYSLTLVSSLNFRRVNWYRKCNWRFAPITIKINFLLQFLICICQKSHLPFFYFGGTSETTTKKCHSVWLSSECWILLILLQPVCGSGAQLELVAGLQSCQLCAPRCTLVRLSKACGAF